MKCKKYVAGKYTGERAPLARKYTNRIFESKYGTISMKIANHSLKDTTFLQMICLSSPILLKYRLIKYRNELLGHPVTGNKEMSKCIEILNASIMHTSLQGQQEI